MDAALLAARTRRVACTALFCALALAWLPALGQGVGSPPTPAASEADAASSPGLQADPAQVAALARANAAVIGLKVKAVDEASTSDTLGDIRLGSGVVIGSDGLVLTIGYLILEADTVELVLDGGGEVPARVVAYDQATGFGLVQALVPLKIEPAPLGDSGAVSEDDPLMVTSGGEDGAIGLARLVSRRSFSGYWEYHIDGALFTAPPRTDHSGAGLFDAHGRLVGIGSLLVLDSLGIGRPRVPGNMFVPIDLLKPILQELRTTGETRSSHRPWLGLNCVEQAGEVRVLKVNENGPAMEAGVQAGDRILKIDGAPVNDLAGFYELLWKGSQPDREVRLDITRNGQARSMKIHARDRMSTLRKAQGI